MCLKCSLERAEQLKVEQLLSFIKERILVENLLIIIKLKFIDYITFLSWFGVNAGTSNNEVAPLKEYTLCII